MCSAVIDPFRRVLETAVNSDVFCRSVICENRLLRICPSSGNIGLSIYLSKPVKICLPYPRSMRSSSNGNMEVSWIFGGKFCFGLREDFHSILERNFRSYEASASSLTSLISLRPVLSIFVTNIFDGDVH